MIHDPYERCVHAVPPQTFKTKVVLDYLKKESQSLEDGTAQCTDHIEGLRLKVVMLELKFKILKAQHATDQARIKDLHHDLYIWQETCQDLNARFKHMSEELKHRQVCNGIMQQESHVETNIEHWCTSVDVHYPTLTSELEIYGICYNALIYEHAPLMDRLHRFMVRNGLS